MAGEQFVGPWGRRALTGQPDGAMFDGDTRFHDVVDDIGLLRRHFAGVPKPRRVSAASIMASARKASRSGGRPTPGCAVSEIKIGFWVR
jgi:hypothetical protein